MRIGLIAPQFPPRIGGMQRTSEHIARGLAGTDEVTVFLRQGNGVENAPFEQKNVLSRDYRRDVASLRNEHFDVWLSLTASYASIAGSLDGPVCVYCHGNDFLRTNSFILPTWAAFLPARPPVVRGWQQSIVQYSARAAFRRGLCNVDRVFANSRLTANLFEDMYGIRSEVVSPGVENCFFTNDAPAPDLPTEQGLRLLTVSRLDRSNRRKNIDGVLHALTMLPPDFNARYTVIGDGSDRPRLEGLARELGLADRVRFAGQIDMEGLLREYRRADLYVMASTTLDRDVEGFGLTYLEACAAGKPVVCSRTSGFAEYVVDGESGIVIDRTDPESIADGIARFVACRHALTRDRIRSLAESFRWANVVSRLRCHLLEVAA